MPQRRRLAAPRRTEQHQELTVGHVEVEVVDRDHVVEALGDAVEADVGHPVRQPRCHGAWRGRLDAAPSPAAVVGHGAPASRTGRIVVGVRAQRRPRGGPCGPWSARGPAHDRPARGGCRGDGAGHPSITEADVAAYATGTVDTRAARTGPPRWRGAVPGDPPCRAGLDRADLVAWVAATASSKRRLGGSWWPAHAPPRVDGAARPDRRLTGEPGVAARAEGTWVHRPRRRGLAGRRGRSPASPRPWPRCARPGVRRSVRHQQLLAHARRARRPPGRRSASPPSPTTW